MANALLYNAIVKRNSEIVKTLNEDITAKALAALQTTPWVVDNWVLLPYCDAAAPADYVYTCTTAANGNCGAACTWTVPVGATQAMFQVWGPGSHTHTGCCCGGDTYGSNGAYVVAISDVAEGDTYCLCAGCAACCWATRGASPTRMCGSTVSTIAATNTVTLCASGGCSGVIRQMEIINGNAACCRLQARGNTQAGACICNQGADYCGGSCASCGEVEYIADTDLSFSATVPNGTSGGLPVMYPITCFDSNLYGYKIRPPVINETHTGAVANTCQCCATYTSGTCCGGCQCSYANSFTQVFGAGATMTHLMGGGNSNCGDMGRGGLVKVSWW